MSSAERLATARAQQSWANYFMGVPVVVPPRAPVPVRGAIARWRPIVKLRRPAAVVAAPVAAPAPAPAPARREGMRAHRAIEAGGVYRGAPRRRH